MLTRITRHILFCGSLHVLSLETLESSLGDLDVGDESVKLVDAVLVLVPEPGEADPHPEGDSPHSLGPDGLVQPGVDPHVLGAHLLLSKLLNLLHSTGSAVLEPDTVQPLVQVDGVLPGDDLAHGGPSLFSPRRHSYCLSH